MGVLLLMATVAVASAEPPEEFSGKVVGIRDGDTISVLRDGKAVKVRLEGIDAPEQGQAYSDVARNGLAHAVFEKVVEVRVAGRDYYGRLLGRIYLQGIDINLELVNAGLVCFNNRYSSDKALAETQKMQGSRRDPEDGEEGEEGPLAVEGTSGAALGVSREVARAGDRQ